MFEQLDLIKNSTPAAIFRWKPAAWLRVSGPDAATFLQGQFTNELRGLKTGDSTYGLWLSVKGKVLADSFVIRGSEADEFWVGSYFSGAAAIRERLESFIIADDVVVEDVTMDRCALTVWGSPEGRDGHSTERPGEVAFAGHRGREASFELVFPRVAEAAILARFARITELSTGEVARRRIEAGIPAVPMDVGAADLPQEAGLENGAISFTKGCYLGQEVMARLKSMGKVRRRLMRVSGSVEMPATPSPLFVGAKQVGELRSAVGGDGGFVGLAMLSLLHVRGDVPLALAADGAGVVRLLDAP